MFKIFDPTEYYSIENPSYSRSGLYSFYVAKCVFLQIQQKYRHTTDWDIFGKKKYYEHYAPHLYVLL